MRRFHDVKVMLAWGRGCFGSQRWSLVERAVRSVVVVVVDVVVDEPLELVLVPDDGAVEEFAAYRYDPAFGVGVGHRRADRTPEDLEAFGAEDLVESVDELAASVSDQGS